MSDSCSNHGCSPLSTPDQVSRYRRVLWVALMVNAAMFLVELAGGLQANSVSLLADAVDFFGDAFNYGVSLTVLGMAAVARARAALLKGMMMGAFGIFVLARAAWATANGSAPEPFTMGVIGIVALAANVTVAIMLFAWREGDANMRSVWLCSRNDALGNIAVVGAALGVFGTGSAWPDLVVAAVMATLALSAAYSVCRHALAELREAAAPSSVRTPATAAEPSLLSPTPLLDFEHSSIVELVEARGWRKLPEFERIGSIYDFVRNEVAFGYNESDELPASMVLADGVGQCNTKGTLLMALLRACAVPCRFHGFTIHKQLQKGAITGVAYTLAPERIIHSWVEVNFGGKWLNLEGFILDTPYLSSLQRRFADRKQFCGYGAATPDLGSPAVEWQGRDTYIQKDGIVDDYGVFDSPDDFYEQYGSNLSGAKRWIYKHVVRHRMNAQVQRIRDGNW